MEPLTISISAACYLSSFGKTKLYDLINSGKLETIRIGRRRLVKVSSLHKLIGEDA